PEILQMQAEILWGLVEAELAAMPPRGTSKSRALDSARCESWRDEVVQLRNELRLEGAELVDCARVELAARGLRVDDADAQLWLLDRLVIVPAERAQAAAGSPILAALRSPAPPMHDRMRQQLA